MILPEENQQVIVHNLLKMEECLNTEKGLQNCLNLLSLVAFPAQGVLDITHDPTAMFVALIIIEQFGLIQKVYDDRSQAWYDKNENNIKETKKALLEYTKDLK